MNRLKLHKAYLIGPMDHSVDCGKQWREDMSAWLMQRGIIPLDPYNKPIRYLNKMELEDDDGWHERQTAKKDGDYDTVSDFMKSIRHIDLRMVDHCDFIIANITYEDRPTGTWEELFWANRSKKPILVHYAGGKHRVSDWLFGTIPHQFIFGDWDGLKEYVRHIDTDEDIDTLGRWIFFDLEDTIRSILDVSRNRNSHSVDNSV